ncbi:MAG: NUDIX domain-containing protein, partial [Candidatus Rokuibacteriota bacterium]
MERDPDHREAAVALLVRPRADLEILLIKRAEHPRDPWSGHMALPGGRRSTTDADLVATAFRETEEETGVPV